MIGYNPSTSRFGVGNNADKITLLKHELQSLTDQLDLPLNAIYRFFLNQRIDNIKAQIRTLGG
jgi:hypothetical protein